MKLDTHELKVAISRFLEGNDIGATAHYVYPMSGGD